MAPTSNTQGTRQTHVLYMLSNRAINVDVHVVWTDCYGNLRTAKRRAEPSGFRAAVRLTPCFNIHS